MATLNNTVKNNTVNGFEAKFEAKILARKTELAARKAAKGAGYSAGYVSATAKRLVDDIKEKVSSTSLGIEYGVGYNMGEEDAELAHIVNNMDEECKLFYEEQALEVMKALADLGLEKRYIGKRIKVALLSHDSSKIEDYDYRICRVVEDAGIFRKIDIKALVKWGFGC